MKTGIIKNVLLSVAMHGIAFACCFAFPAPKLVPLFLAGDSALTLTSLSIYQPGAGTPGNSLTLPEERRDAGNHPAEETELEINKDEENNPDHLLIESRDMHSDKPSLASPQGNVKNTRHQTEGEKPALFLDGDFQTKGIAGDLATNSGVYPCYPLGARLRGEEGIVKVEALVSAGGHVLDCAVIKSSGFPALDEAALTAVKCACFATARGIAPTKDSKRVLTFRFDLID